MSKRAKCRYCLKEIEPSSRVKKVDSKQYHIDCYKQRIEDKYKTSNKDGVSEKQELYEYIAELYKVDELDPKIMAQILKTVVSKAVNILKTGANIKKDKSYLSIIFINDRSIVF